MAKRVAVTLSFDLLHDGHIDHLEKAHKLGDKVIIIVDPDEFLLIKNFCIMPLKARMRVANFLAENIDWIDKVVVSIDRDGTCAETLRMLKPDILAKGGDRIPENMPENEIKVCQDIGCQIVYGVGDLLNSRTELIEGVCKVLWEKLR